MLRQSYDPSGNVTAQVGAGVAPPQIAGQPVQQIIELGQVATFSVVVTDASSVAYQWKFNGAPIAGATGDSLIVSNASAANQGQYSVVVTNSAGSVTSAPAALMLDSDRDGLPDSWETMNFGNLTSQTSEGDPDSDKISNLDEFLDNTGPLSSASHRPRLVAYGEAGGVVSATPTKLSYATGEIVTLTATAIAPSVFVGWTGDLSGAANPATVTMSANKTIRAKFASEVPIQPGMVAFWRGEVDASDPIGAHNGSFFSGTTAVGPSITPSGKVRKAFSFDGVVHVRVPDSEKLKPRQITIEAWIFPTAIIADHQTVIARGSPTNDDDTWWMGIWNGVPRFWSNHVGGGMLNLQAPSAIPLNAWTHLAISFDGLIKRLYVNGVQVASQGGLGELIYDPAPVPVTIGTDWRLGASGGGFTGNVDEVSLYNRALTSTEIADIYNADRLGKTVSRPYFTSPSQLPDAAVGASSYSFQLGAVLGTTPFRFLARSPLPRGAGLSASGLISSTTPLSVAGVSSFTVRATDAAGKFTEQIFVLRVLRPIALPAGMVAFWKAEADASESIGGHNGTFFSGTTAVGPSIASGKVGNAFHFDGTVYVQVPDSASLKPAQITVEAWIFPTVISPDHQTVIARGSPNNDDDAWWMGLFNGKPRFWSKHVATGMTLLEGPFAVSLNDWTHLAISFDGVKKSLYVNGVEVASQTGLTALVYEPAPVPVTIGADWRFGASSGGFTGQVDEASVYRRALSAAEVFSIFDAGPAGKSLAGPYITSSPDLPPAIAGQPYSYGFTSVLGTSPIVFSVRAGSAVPAGLTLSTSGALSGTPTGSSSAAFTVRATDSTGSFYDLTCNFRVYQPVIAPAGMIGWWKAEGNAVDSSGGSHDGAPTASVVYATAQVGQGFLLNGVDSFIAIADTPALRPTSLSIELWLKLGSILGTRVIVAKPVGSGTSDSYAIWLQNGVLNGAVGGPTGFVSVASPFSLATDRWYHVAYTFDDSADRHALYVDGVPVRTAAATISIGYDNQPVLLGRDTENGVPNFFLQGQIDEAAMYSRTLTGAEIASIYLAGPAGKHL